MIKVNVENGHISDADRKKLKEEYTIEFIPYDKIKTILTKVKEVASKDYVITLHKNRIELLDKRIANDDNTSDDDIVYNKQKKTFLTLAEKIGSLFSCDLYYAYEFDNGEICFLFKDSNVLNISISYDYENGDEIIINTFFRTGNMDGYFEDRDGKSITGIKNNPMTKDSFFSKTKYDDYEFNNTGLSMENLKLINTNIITGIPNLHERAKYNPSNEEFGVYVSQIASFFTSQVKAIAETFTGVVSRLSGTDGMVLTRSGKELFEMRQSIDKIKQTVKLSEIEKIQVPILLGMKLSLPDSLDKITRGFDVIDKELINLLKEADDTVAKVLNSKDFRMQTKPLQYKSDIDIHFKLYEIIGEIIDENGVKDRADLGNVIPSINSFDTCYDAIMKLNSVATIKRIEEIKALSKTITDRTNTLYKFLSENKDTNITHNVLEHLGMILEYSAKAVTSSITMIYVYNQSLDTFKNAVILVNKYVESK